MQWTHMIENQNIVMSDWKPLEILSKILLWLTGLNFIRKCNQNVFINWKIIINNLTTLHKMNQWTQVIENGRPFNFNLDFDFYLKWTQAKGNSRPFNFNFNLYFNFNLKWTMVKDYSRPFKFNFNHHFNFNSKWTQVIENGRPFNDNPGGSRW